MLATRSARNFPSAASASEAFGVLVAALMVGEEHLAAGRDPLDRPPDPLRRPQQQRMLGIDKVLGAEPAADIGRDKAHLRGLDAQRAGSEVAGDVDALRGDMRRVAPARLVVSPDDAARLHRVGDHPVVVELDGDDMRRIGEGGVDRCRVTAAPVEAEIARRFVRQ